MSMERPKKPRGKQPIRYTDGDSGKPYPVFVTRSFWFKQGCTLRLESFQLRVIAVYPTGTLPKGHVRKTKSLKSLYATLAEDLLKQRGWRLLERS